MENQKYSGLDLWDLLLAHRGHELVVASYGDPDNPQNVSLECETCETVVLDAELYTLCVRSEDEPTTGDNYKVKQLQKMLAHETSESEAHYGANLSHWYGDTNALTIDAGGLNALIQYYQEHDTDLDAPVQPLLMSKEKAYRTIAKHLFRAHLKYEGSRALIILADSIEEATEKAVAAFGLNSVSVKRIDPTDDPQVYGV